MWPQCVHILVTVSWVPGSGRAVPRAGRLVLVVALTTGWAARLLWCLFSVGPIGLSASVGLCCPLVLECSQASPSPYVAAPPSPPARLQFPMYQTC